MGDWLKITPHSAHSSRSLQNPDKWNHVLQKKGFKPNYVFCEKMQLRPSFAKNNKQMCSNSTLLCGKQNIDSSTIVLRKRDVKIC